MIHRNPIFFFFFLNSQFSFLILFCTTTFHKMDQVNTQFIGPHVIFHVESKSVLFFFQKIAPLRCGLWLIFLINPIQDQVINT